MNPLPSRKKLLIAESELNRSQLVEECQQMSVEVSALASRAGNINSIATAVMSLVTVLLSSKSSNAAPEKHSWWQTLLKGAQPVAALWAVFRDRPK